MGAPCCARVRDAEVDGAGAGDGPEEHAVVVLATGRGGLLVDLVEVWAEVGAEAGVPSDSARRPDLG